MKKILVLLGVLLVLLLMLASCSEIEVTYVAGEGGYIVGQATQSAKLDNGEAQLQSVQAVANEGYRFTGWSDGLSDPIRTDKLTQGGTFTASFEKINYVTITYSAQMGGMISGKATQKIEVGKRSEAVTAIAEEGYDFIGWDDGVKTLTREDVGAENKSYTAMFELHVERATIEYKVGEGATLVGEAVQSVEIGRTADIVRVVLEKGYRFVGWDDGHTSRERLDTAEKDVVYTAIIKKYHNVSFAPNNSDLGYVSGELTQMVDDGEYAVEVSATVTKQGYKFLCWSNGETDTKINYLPTQDAEIYAIFIEDCYELPVISIRTDGLVDITSKDEYLYCRVTTSNTEQRYTMTDEVAQVKGRGNTTWEQAQLKKPYKLKFNHKVPLLGDSVAKDWTLIPSYSDKSLIRNYLAYTTASELSALSATTDVMLVELWLNNEYWGVYLACEEIEVGENRVEIDDSLKKYDTGYLIELDGRSDGKSFGVLTTLKNNDPASGGDTEVTRKYVIHAPDPDNRYYTKVHTAFIEQYVQKCMDALEGDDYSAVEALIDTESFAQAYIIYELFKCADVGWSSFYMYKQGGGKMVCGPIWDFDLSIGNINYNNDASNPENLYARNSNEWFSGLFRFEEFNELFLKTFKEKKPIIESALDNAYKYALACPLSFNRNFEKWDILNTYVYPNTGAISNIKTWEGQVEYTREFLKQSMVYMLTQYNIE